MIAVLAAAALSTLKFLVAMVPVFSVGVIVAEFIVALGWVNKIAWITQPLTRIGHLKPECGASFLTAFLSPSAGNAMLVRHHEAGLITRKELIIAAIVNTFPGIVMHWRTVLPIAIPLIGIYAFVYYGFLLLVGLLKTIAAMLAGHFLLEPDNAHAIIPSAEKQEGVSPSWALWVESAKKSRKIIIRVIKTTIPVTAVMFVLIHAGISAAVAQGPSHCGHKAGQQCGSIHCGRQSIVCFKAFRPGSCVVTTGWQSSGQWDQPEVPHPLLFRDFRPGDRMAGAGCFNGIAHGNHGCPDLDFVCNLDLRVTTDLPKR